MALSAIQAFRREVARPDGDISIARAALAFARYRYPDLDTEYYVGMLDDFARPLRGALPDLPTKLASVRALSTAEEAIAAINERLFKELGFHGNVTDYGEARNSYLNEVLERRTGIPITLACVYLEVANRVGLPLVPVGFPGHFLVKHSGPPLELVLDPFTRGRQMQEKELQATLDGFYQGRVRLDRSMLRPATHSETLYRMLNNLKILHTKAQEAAYALAVVDMMLVLQPESPVDVRDRGFALHALGNYSEAAGELRRYLSLAPGAPDSAQVRGVLDAVERMAEMLR
jgi:regulator of sirC expression with transglutaminase-like and TPR domain